MSGLQRTTLGECCDIVSGATPSTSVAAYWDGDIEWATPKDLSDLEGKLISRTARRVTGEGLASCAASVLPPNSVLFSSRAPIGHVAVNAVPMATNQGFKSFVPKANRVEPSFLYHWLRAHRAYLESLGNGATFKEVSKAVVSRVEIELPPLAEQRRIADILDKADAIRRKRKEAIALTEELLRSTFLEMFGDPVTNPMGWPVRSLGEVVELFAGNSLPSGVEFSGQCDGYLLMKVGDMNIPGNEVEVTVAREWAATVPSAAVIAPAGAVVIPKRGGAIATNKKRVLTRAAALDPNLMAIAPRASLQLDFLRQWFEGIDLARLSNGSAVPQLNKKDLAPLTIPVPSSQSQVKFAEYAKRIRAMRTRAERGQAEADDLFNSLVARAFSGGLEASL